MLLATHQVDRDRLLQVTALLKIPIHMDFFSNRCEMRARHFAFMCVSVFNSKSTAYKDTETERRKHLNLSFHG